MEYSLSPLLAKFRTSRFAYAYDGNTGHIARVDEALFERLKECTPFTPITFAPATGLQRADSAVDERHAKLVEMGLFRPVNIKNTIIPFDAIKHNVAQLVGKFTKMTLEVTGQCNLRCCYCPFTVGHEMRSHNKSEMGWGLAKKAIDYFLEHLCQVSDVGSARPNLGFYGGEPLLAFSIIRQAADYVSKCAPDVGFSCTTNGTLLDKEIGDFCAQHEIALLISLDGPREVHDRNRHSADDHGSFDLVWNNIKRLRERHGDYYRKLVRFEATVSAHADVGEIIKFFLSEPTLFYPGRVMINPAARFDISMADPLNEYRKCAERYEEKLLSGTMTDDAESQMLRQLFGKAYQTFQSRRKDIRGITGLGCLGAACFPGFGRLFVSTAGEYYLCERINRRIAIGSVEHGIDHERIVEFYRMYWKYFHSTCSHCWAIGLCGICYVQFARGAEDCLKVCQQAIDAWRQRLVRYCSILESNPRAFDHLRDLRPVATIAPDFGKLITAACSNNHA